MGERAFLERIISSLEQSINIPMVEIELDSEQLRLFMERSQMTAWITDGGGKLAFVSSKYLDVFQTPFSDPSEVVGKTIFDLYPTEVANDLLANIQQVVRSKNILEVVETVPLKNGSSGDFLVRKFPVAQNPVLIGGIAIDITEYRHGEDLIRQSENRLKLALEASGDGLWDWNIQAGTLFLSDLYTGMIGYETTAVQPSFEFWQSIMHPDDHDWVLERLKGHLERSEPYAFDYRIKLNDGGWKWVANYGKVVAWDRHGKPSRMIGTHQDIDDRKRAEESLRQSEAKNRAMLMAIPDLLLRVKRDGTCLDFIPPTDGESQKFLPVHSHLSEVLPPELLQNQLQRIAQALATGDLQSWEHQFTKHGVLCDEEVRLVPCGDDEVLMIVRDISDRKQAEEKLKTANEHLSHLVEELEKRNDEIELLNSLSDVLQSCSSTDEAYNVVGDLISPVLEGSGGIYLLNQSRTLAECVSTWNGSPASKELFNKNQCWALKRGKTHYVDIEKQPSLLCQHADPKNGCTICVPLIAKGLPIGILHVTNPHVLNEVRRRLISAVAENVALAFANLHLYETLQNESIRDPLTGLFNRRYLEESLDREISRAVRNGQPLCVAMLDVDSFKKYNDSYGHDAGDVVLQQIGRLLIERIRTSDIACRYGGEELLLILPETDMTGGTNLVEEIREEISRMNVVYQRRKLGTVTASIGLAIYPKDGSGQRDLIRAADTALYAAKHKGRNQTVVYGTETEGLVNGQQDKQSKSSENSEASGVLEVLKLPTLVATGDEQGRGSP